MREGEINKEKQVRRRKKYNKENKKETEGEEKECR